MGFPQFPPPRTHPPPALWIIQNWLGGGGGGQSRKRKYSKKKKKSSKGKNDLKDNVEMHNLIPFFSIFCFALRARAWWPLLCLCRPFCIFVRWLDSNTESCCSIQARYQLSHLSLHLALWMRSVLWMRSTVPEWLEHLAVNAKVATVLGLIPASSETIVSDGGRWSSVE